MKTVIKTKNEKLRFNRILESVLYIVGYTLSFFLISKIFKSFHLSNELPLLYAFIAVIIIYVLNKTVRPLIMVLTIPITGLTLGTFYFVVNTFIPITINTKTIANNTNAFFIYNPPHFIFSFLLTFFTLISYNIIKKIARIIWNFLLFFYTPYYLFLF